MDARSRREAVYEFTRILKPLEPFRNDITLVSGLANLRPQRRRAAVTPKASGSFLSGHPAEVHGRRGRSGGHHVRSDRR